MCGRSLVPSFCHEETEAQSGVLIGLGVPWQFQATLAPSIQLDWTLGRRVPRLSGTQRLSGLWVPGGVLSADLGAAGQWEVWPTG